MLPRLIAQILCANFPSMPAHGRNHPASPQDPLPAHNANPDAAYRSYMHSAHRRMLGYFERTSRLRLQRQQATGAGDV